MEFQGQEVLSLQDALCHSTRESISDVIEKTIRPTRNYLRAHLQEPIIFLGSRVTCFCEDPSCNIKTPMCIFNEEVYKQKWYQKGLPILLEEFRDEYLQVSHQGYSALTWHHEHNPQEP